MPEGSEWVRVASVGDLIDGAGFDSGVEVDGDVVGLFLIDGTYYAVGECTHERGPICQGHREGLVVSCPWHSARFNVATGECLQGPVACRTDGSVMIDADPEIERVDPLTRYEVKSEGGEIFVRSCVSGGGSPVAAGAEPAAAHATRPLQA